MSLSNWNSYSLSEAKMMYQQGHIQTIRIDHALDNWTMQFITNSKYDFEKTKPLRTSNGGKQKLFKSLSAIAKDYEYITGKPLAAMELK